MSKCKKSTFTREEVKELLTKFVHEADVYSLIELEQWNNGDGFIDSNGYVLGEGFEKWFEENV